MSAYFTTAEILAVTRGTLIQGDPDATFCAVSTDSRTAQSGQLFVPLKGEQHDGHKFIPGALHRGVRGMLVEGGWYWGERARGPASRAPLGLPPEVTVIAVPDTLAALGDLARAWRDRFTLPLVAITGSCGKTTTKEMTAQVLSRAYRVLKNPLNLNNLIGLPLTLLGLGGVHEAAVVEMGMNRFGEILRLTRISRPTIGVLTNVHPAHTEGVGDISGVARAKGELIQALNHGALLIYNADDPWLAPLARDFPGLSLGFGLAAGADLRATDRELQGSRGQSARLTFQGRTWPLTLKAPGLHMLYNALAATAAGLSLGLAPEDTAQALAAFKCVARRSQVATLPSGVHLLNDCYNANPGSMAMALTTLRELRGQARAAAALGDMLELGDGAAPAHRELGRQAALSGLDLLVIYGNFKGEVAAGARAAGLAPERLAPVASHRHGAQILKEFLKGGDWLLVKGSRGMHMEGLIAALEE
jgi:UDP-N-acetylmuramoyl-tripeptide--D-alanyl-D-alanine ligase